MSAGYDAMSRYSHGSFAALLDCYDVWHDDFDFEQNAGYHYARTKGLAMMRSTLRTLLVNLKAFFHHCSDHEKQAMADELLREHTDLYFGTSSSPRPPRAPG